MLDDVFQTQIEATPSDVNGVTMFDSSTNALVTKLAPTWTTFILLVSTLLRLTGKTINTFNVHCMLLPILRGEMCAVFHCLRPYSDV